MSKDNETEGKKSKLCPLNGLTSCARDECAWWVLEKSCVLVLISAELHLVGTRLDVIGERDVEKLIFSALEEDP